MELKPAKINKLFTSIALHYDTLNRILSFGQDIRWRRLLAKKSINSARPLLALDICTGTGDLSIEFLKTAKSQSKVFALDFSPKMLKVAQQKMKLNNFSNNISFVEGDALNLPFNNSSFDLSMMAFGIRNLPNIELAFREMVRVTHKNGTISLLEFSLPRTFPLRQLSALYVKIIIPFIGKTLTKSDAYKHLAVTINQFPPPDAIRSLMLKCGISAVKTYKRMFGIVTLFIGSVK